MKKLVIFVLSIFILGFAVANYRNFYTVGDVTFTVWKKFGEGCYIIPYRYYGLTSPTDNYITICTNAFVSIIVVNDSTLRIDEFASLYKVDFDTKIKLTDYEYSYQKEPWRGLPYLEYQEAQAAYNEEMDKLTKLYPYIMFDFRDLGVIINNPQ